MICNRRSIPHLCGVGAWGSRNPHVFWYFSQEKYDKSHLCDLPKHKFKGTKWASSPTECNYSFVSTQRDVRGPSPYGVMAYFTLSQQPFPAKSCFGRFVNRPYANCGYTAGRPGAVPYEAMAYFTSTQQPSPAYSKAYVGV